MKNNLVHVNFRKLKKKKQKESLLMFLTHIINKIFGIPEGNPKDHKVIKYNKTMC